MPDMTAITANISRWILAPCSVGIALLLYAFDPPIMRGIQRLRSKASDAVAIVVKPLGDGLYTIPPLALIFLIGLAVRAHWTTRLFLLCFISFLLTGAVCQTLQALTRRHRPSNSDTARDWDGPGLRSVHRSFPSGHASASASVLVVIGLFAQHLLPVQCAAFGLALLVSLSRLNDRAHWPSDVFTGAVIGTCIAYFTVHLVHLPLSW